MLNNQNNEIKRRSFIHRLGGIFSQNANRVVCGNPQVIYTGTSMSIRMKDALDTLVCGESLCRCENCLKVQGRCPYTNLVGIYVCGVHKMIYTVGEIRELALRRMAIDRLDPNSLRVQLMYQGRELLHDTKPMHLYGNGGMISVIVSPRLLGGSYKPQGISLRTVPTGDRQQSIKSDAEDDTFVGSLIDRLSPQYENVMLNMAVSGQYVGTLLEKHKDSIKFIEDIVIFLYQIWKSKSMQERSVAVVNFVKLRTGDSITCSTLKNLIMSAVNIYFKYHTQSMSFKDVVDGYKSAKKSPLCKKLHKFSLMVIGVSLFDKIGMKIEAEKVHRLAENGVDKCEWKSLDFVHTVIDTIQFVCERGYQCIQMGSWQPLFHSGKNYEVWFDEARELQRLSKLTSHFELENVSDEEFSTRLDKCIEVGVAMIAALKMQNNESVRYVTCMVGELKLVRTLYRARSNASASRQEPLGVLLFGGSCVMKSQLQDLMGFHYGKVMGIPTGSEHKYVRNYRDKNWSGYNGQWWIVLDEIAPYKPSQVQGIDPTIEELQVIINTMAVITTQAELENKGKIPLKPRLVTATTNVEDLNAGLYYMNPLAVRRRVPFQVTVAIKPEYRQKDENGNMTEMVDPKLVPEVEEGNYLNIWELTVNRVVGKRDASTGKQFPATEVVGKFTDIYDFLECFSRFAVEKSQILKKADIDRERMFAVKLCKECYRPNDHCKCESVLGIKFKPQTLINCSQCSADVLQCFCKHPDHYATCSSCTCVWRPVNVEARSPDTYIMRDRDGKMISVPGHDVRYVGNQHYHLTPFVPTPEFYEALNEEADQVTMVVNSLVPSRENPIRAWIVRKFLERYLKHQWLQNTIKKCLYISWMRSLFIWCAVVLIPKPCRAVFLFLGQTMEAKYRQHPLLFKIAGLAAILGSSWCIMSWFRRDSQNTWDMGKADRQEYTVRVSKRDSKPEELVEQVKVVAPSEEHIEYVEQRAIVEPSLVPFEREFENQWALHDIKLADRPDSPQQISWKNMSDDEIASAVKHSCVRISVTDGHIKKENNAMCVVGHWYAVNWHAWIPGGKVTITFGAQGNGIVASQTVECDKLRTRRWKNSDVMFVEFLSLPVRRDLRDLFAGWNVDARGYALICIFNDGDIEMEKLVKASYYQEVTIDSSTTRCFSALSRAGLKEGDCGSPWFIRTNGSTFIAGIHYWQVGASKEVGCAQITRQMIDECIGKGPFTDDAPPLLKQGGYELVIGGLRKHSHVSYIEEGSAIVFGSRPGFRRSPKSTVRPTCIADYCAQRGYSVDFAAPDMNWRSYHKALTDMTHINVSMDNNVLEKCAEAFVNDVKPYCDARMFPAKRITQHESINGIDGVAYVDAMNRKTSAGAPFWKNKKHFLTEMDDGSWSLNAELQNTVDEYMQRYARGQRCVPIYSTAQKDEPKKRSKCRDGARIFICSSLPWCIVVRRYLMWFVRLIQNHRGGFECAVGVSAQCIEWDVLLRILTKFSGGLFAGDYKAYDKQMGANVIHFCFEIIARVAGESGADDEMIRAIYAIAEDVAFAFVDFDGDLIMFLGSNPSGHPLTVIINCLCGSLYFRYAFVDITGKDPKFFKQYVSLLTYGDDNAASVSPDLPEFNHTSVMLSLAKCGITYTTADKESESTPYQPLDQISFLKRYFVKVGKRTFAPLEKDSIIKMLTIHTKSKSLCEEEQTVRAMQSAVREAAMHGEDYYNEIRTLCEGAIEECGLDLWHEIFPSFQYLMLCWDVNSLRILNVYKSRGGISGLDSRDYSELMSYCDELSARFECGINYEEKQ